MINKLILIVILIMTAASFIPVVSSEKTGSDSYGQDALSEIINHLYYAIYDTGYFKNISEKKLSVDESKILSDYLSRYASSPSDSSSIPSLKKSNKISRIAAFYDKIYARIFNFLKSTYFCRRIEGYYEQRLSVYEEYSNKYGVFAKK